MVSPRTLFQVEAHRKDVDVWSLGTHDLIEIGCATMVVLQCACVLLSQVVWQDITSSSTRHHAYNTIM
jgi:hypothetical protein